jgi:hypothetical protein
VIVSVSSAIRCAMDRIGVGYIPLIMLDTGRTLKTKLSASVEPPTG